jgi:hypothetical protein
MEMMTLKAKRNLKKIKSLHRTVVDSAIKSQATTSMEIKGNLILRSLDKVANRISLVSKASLANVLTMS